MDLNIQQQAAAEYAGEKPHVLVLAGAGTGKTRTITARVIHLIRHGNPASRILLLTFTRRAAREMIHRLRNELDSAADQITAGTFHHFCLLVMRRIPRTFGVEERSIIDRDDQLSLIRLIRAGFVKKGKKEFPPAAAILNYISYSRNTTRPLTEYLDEFTDLDPETIRQVDAIAAGYDERKNERRYLDYDDILFRFADAANRSEALRAQLGKLFDHVLVDEMQDTNPLQWSILEALCNPAHLFCVGDDAQSIYAFRGADFRNVHSFTERIPNSIVLKLEQNYRSTQEILDLSNWLLEESNLEYDKKLSAVRGKGIQPRLMDFQSRYDESEWITEDLLKRREGGARWNEHMVLLRTVWSARVLEGSFIERDIPYRFIGGTSLLEAAHVKDLLALFRASYNRRDELAWMRYLKLWPGIGDVTAAKAAHALIDAAGEDDVIPVLEKTLKKHDDVVGGIQLARRHGKKPDQAITQCAAYLSPTLQKKYDRWDSRLRDFELLSKLATRHENLPIFIETYTLDPVTNSELERSEVEDLVTLITVHSAKGTECKVCYVLQVQPGMYPHSRSLGNESAEEEERRVLYVALTRAEDELIITRNSDADRNLYHGGSFGRAAVTHYLLDGLPRRLVDTGAVGYHQDFGSALDLLEEIEL